VEWFVFFSFSFVDPSPSLLVRVGFRLFSILLILDFWVVGFWGVFEMASFLTLFYLRCRSTC